MPKEIKTADQIINDIGEVLAEASGDFIAQIANQVLTGEVVYQEDSLFEHQTPE